MSPTEDETAIRHLVQEFSNAVERCVPREMAALMCADEAEGFLDRVADPDADGAAVDEVITLGFREVRVFGDLAVARFTRSSANVQTLYLRRESGRWTVCADAEDELSLAQLEPDPKPDGHQLRHNPIGELNLAELRVLVDLNEGLDHLMRFTLHRLEWGRPFPGDLFATTLRIEDDYWSRDPVSLTRLRFVIDKLHEKMDPDWGDVPRSVIKRLISDFERRHPRPNPGPHPKARRAVGIWRGSERASDRKTGTSRCARAAQVGNRRLRMAEDGPPRCLSRPAPAGCPAC
jgi:hypothetical protein